MTEPPATDDWLRRHLRGEPDPDAPLDELRRHAAAAVGLQIGLAPRLRGDTYAEILDDAATVAADVNPTNNQPAKRPPPSFDGGPRQSPHMEEPDMTAHIQASLDTQRLGVEFEPHRYRRVDIVNGPDDI